MNTRLPTLILLISMTLLSGCDGAPVRSYEVSGHVRNVWAYSGVFHIVFEHDNGEATTYQTLDQPPVWAGEHVRMQVREPGVGCCVEISRVRRVD